MYQNGDYVVKANTGICKVESITRMCLSGMIGEKDYYVLLPLDDKKAKVFVPVDSEKSNMRSAMDREAAWDLIHRIPEIETRWIESDKRREQEYKDAMRSNEPEHLVSIIKNLYIRVKTREQQGKKTTAIDDRYFKMAENALYGELAHALGEEKDHMRDLIKETLDQHVSEEI